MSTARLDSELVDLLDELGIVTGTTPRAAMRHGNLRHRTVFIAVLNSSGSLLVHRRAEWKDLWPSAWDLAFGGVVDAGEGWETAAARELAEETGLDLELMYLGEDTYEDEHVQEIARVYLARHDGDITCTDGEVVEVCWIALDDLGDWMHGRDVCPDSVAVVLPRLDAP